MAVRLIRRTTLSQLLDIDAETLHDWDMRNFLPAFGTVGDEIHYSVERVDRFLRERSRNFAPDMPPTVDDLAQHRLLLIDTSVAAERLDVTQAYIRELIHKRQLAAVQYMHEYRLSAQSVDNHMAARNNDTRPPWPVVMHTMGVGKHTVRELVAANRLVDASDGYRRRVTRQSLLALLQGLLPASDPRDWLNDRLASAKPLLTINELALNRDDKLQLRQLVTDGVLQYIKHPTASTQGKQELILPDSHLGYLERTQQPLGRADMAALFDITRQTVDEWLAQGFLDCPLHDHYARNWYQTCAVKILAQYVTRGSSPLKWFHGVRGGAPLLTPDQAATILKVPAGEVLAMVERGELHGLRKPTRSIVFMRYQIVGVRDRQQRQRRARG